MCVIIYSRYPNAIGDRVLIDMAEKNPDGFGAMWYTDGQLQVYRGYGEDVVSAYRRFAQEAASSNSPLAFHFRKRTTGDVGVAMCHPFEAGTGFIMHNGTIDALRPKEEEGESDTFRLAELLAQAERETGHTVLTSPALRKTVSLVARTNRVLYAPAQAVPGNSMMLLNPGLWHTIGRHMISNLYAWDAHRLTNGMYGSAEPEKARKKRAKQLALFQ